MKKLKIINAFLHKLGLEIIRYNPRNNSLLRKKFFFKENIFDLVIDVGANCGSFGKELRKIGYEGDIFSFEPIRSIFRQLQSNAENDKNWYIFNYALGATQGEMTINVSKNFHSSSILEILPTHTNADPSSEYENRETIFIETLDNIFPKLFHAYRNIFLKIDTQGYEYQVLKGSEKNLSKVDTIQLEMSLLPLYKGQVLFDELYRYLVNSGYMIYSIEPGFADPKTGVPFQVDGIFKRL